MVKTCIYLRKSREDEKMERELGKGHMFVPMHPGNKSELLTVSIYYFYKKQSIFNIRRSIKIRFIFQSSSLFFDENYITTANNKLRHLFACPKKYVGFITIFRAIQLLINPCAAHNMFVLFYNFRRGKSNHVKIGESAPRIEAHDSIVTGSKLHYLAIMETESFSDNLRNMLRLLCF